MVTDPSPERSVRGTVLNVISGQGILVTCVKTPDRVKWFHTQSDFITVNILKMSRCVCPVGIARKRVLENTM